MKKLTLLTCSLLAFAVVTQAKEIAAPVTSSKEVVVEPIIIEEVVVAPVVENPWGFINLRAGWDFWSEYGNFKRHEDYVTYSPSNDSVSLSKKTKGFGGELALEAYKSWEYFDLGLGVAYQRHMDRKSTNNVSGGEFSSVPVYVTGRYDINYWDWAATPYIKANVGYSFNFDSKDVDGTGFSYGTKVDDGLYWAAGVGVQYEDFNVDILYGANYAKTKVNGENGSDKFDNDYERVTLSVGYRFNIW